MVTLTKQAATFTVEINRSFGGEYAGWEAADYLLPVAVRERMAPDVHKAVLRLNLAEARSHAWEWKGFLGPDDRIRIFQRLPSGERGALFEGFAVETEMIWDGRNEEAIATAVSRAFRLKRDFVVNGRWMTSKAGAMAYYAGLPCVFNAEGKPNRAATPYEAPAGYPAGAPGVFPFTADDDPNAEFWTLGNVLDYLAWIYNRDQVWVENPMPGDTDYDRTDPVLLDVEGMNLWDALAAAAAKGGCDLWERVLSDEGGLPVFRIALLERGSGPLASLRRQSAVVGEETALDLDETNVHAARVAENTAGAVARPLVGGGRMLYEITVALGKAWDPARLAIPAGEEAWPSKELEGYEASDYVKRYCTYGADFPDYAECGRLWAADTDGRYSAAPYNLPTVDVADLADQEAESWPLMLYPPLPTLTRYSSAGGKPTQNVLVEMSIDNGDNWFVLTGYRVLPDRLGIYIDEANLADLGPKGEVSAADNLFQQLDDDPSQVSVRMTCTIASPHRALVSPAATGECPTAFASVEWFERETLGQVRVRASSSQFTGSGLAVDEADGTADLEAAAEEIQRVAQARALEGRIGVEWPTESVALGDTVEKIDGIDYWMFSTEGPSARRPRIVGIDRHLAADAYSMDIHLDTDRQMPVRPARRRKAPRGPAAVPERMLR